MHHVCNTDLSVPMSINVVANAVAVLTNRKISISQRESKSNTDSSVYVSINLSAVGRLAQPDRTCCATSGTLAVTLKRKSELSKELQGVYSFL